MPKGQAVSAPGGRPCHEATGRCGGGLKGNRTESPEAPGCFLRLLPVPPATTAHLCDPPPTLGCRHRCFLLCSPPAAPFSAPAPAKTLTPHGLTPGTEGAARSVGSAWPARVARLRAPGGMPTARRPAVRLPGTRRRLQPAPCGTRGLRSRPRSFGGSHGSRRLSHPPGAETSVSAAPQAGGRSVCTLPLTEGSLPCFPGKRSLRERPLSPDSVPRESPAPGPSLLCGSSQTRPPATRRPAVLS